MSVVAVVQDVVTTSFCAGTVTALAVRSSATVTMIAAIGLMSRSALFTVSILMQRHLL